MTEIALFLYDGMTALDAVGPYEVLARCCLAAPAFSRASARPATGRVRDYLRSFGAEPVAERVVIEGKVITAGVSAGTDMALTLAAREAGEDEARALQLVIEYDPQPPYDSGSV